MKALITGITGQDGAYLAEHLLKQGYEVIGCHRRSANFNPWRLQWLGVLDKIELKVMDITDHASVKTILDEVMPDEIYNLAAQSFVAESFNSPCATSEINFTGVLHLLEWVKANPASKFYQASTSEMFGLVNVEAQNEDTPFYPRSPYGVAKCAAHHAVINYRETYGLHASCGILFNHESPLRGEEFVTRKITKGIADIKNGKTKVLRLGNLSAMRDWGHAADYVRGMHLMLQHDPDDYVLATGETHSVEEFCRKAFYQAGLNMDDHVVIDPELYRPCEVPLLCGDASKAQTKLGWQRYISFDVLIKEMVNWDVSHGTSSGLQQGKGQVSALRA